MFPSYGQSKGSHEINTPVSDRRAEQSSDNVQMFRGLCWHKQKLKLFVQEKEIGKNFSMASVTNVRKVETHAIIPLNGTVVGINIETWFIKVSTLYSYKMWYIQE